MAVSSPAPRRIATPRWLDLRLVLGVVLVLASVLIGASVVSGASHTYATVAATRDLAAGTVLRAADLRITQVQVPDHGRGVYLDSLRDALGKQLDRPVSRGELLPAAAVDTVTARTTLTVPFASGTAPDLRSGQRIRVWVSTASCSSVVLLSDVAVQDVSQDSGGSFSTGTGGQDVVISVEPALADRVIAALAIDQAQIRAGVLVGAAPSAATPTPTPAPDPSGTGGRRPGLPADLAACVSASSGR